MREAVTLLVARSRPSSTRRYARPRRPRLHYLVLDGILVLTDRPELAQFSAPFPAVDLVERVA